MLGVEIRIVADETKIICCTENVVGQMLLHIHIFGGVESSSPLVSVSKHLTCFGCERWRLCLTRVIDLFSQLLSEFSWDSFLTIQSQRRSWSQAIRQYSQRRDCIWCSSWLHVGSLDGCHCLCIREEQTNTRRRDWSLCCWEEGYEPKQQR